MGDGHRMRGRITGTMVVAVGLALAAPSPASAWLRNFQVVSSSSPLNSSTIKTLGIDCPAGKLSVGAAAFASPALPNLALNYIAPPPGTDSVAGATETDGESARWKLYGRGFCVESTATPPPLGGAASYLKAIEIVRKQSGMNSGSAKSAIARCPAGKTAISGGGAIPEPANDVGLTSMQRVSGGTAWRVTAREVDATGADWGVRATAICANVSTETATNDYAGPGFTGPDILSPAVSNPFYSVAPGCPTGLYVVGGGSAVLNPPGGTKPSDVVLTTSEPPGSGPLATGWIVIAHESDSTNRTWRVAARVICSSIGGPPA